MRNASSAKQRGFLYYDTYCLLKLYGRELFEFLPDTWEYFHGDFLFVSVSDREAETMKKITSLV